jgi:hypothetical protein
LGRWSSHFAMIIKLSPALVRLPWLVWLGR